MTESQKPYKPRLPTDREAWTAANLVIQQHGSGARGHALRMIANLKSDGDQSGAATWRLILDRIEKLQSDERKPTN